MHILFDMLKLVDRPEWFAFDSREELRQQRELEAMEKTFKVFDCFVFYTELLMIHYCRLFTSCCYQAVAL